MRKDYSMYKLYAEEVLIRFADGEGVSQSSLLWAIRAIKKDRSGH